MTLTASYFNKYKKAELVELLVNLTNGESMSLDGKTVESFVDEDDLTLTPEQKVALQKGEVVVLSENPLRTAQLVRNPR
jgi:hypothetical protein